MRGRQVLSLVAAVAVLAGTGCARHEAGGTSVTASAAPSAPAPRDPDLSVIAERYYQLVEGKHWSIADHMLSPRLRASFDEASLQRRYASFTNADVKARQAGDRTIVATLVAPSATLRETLTFRWNGTDWEIDRIASTGS